MVSITKAEKDVLQKAFPRAHIVRTMKQKSKRHHYYCEETNGVMRLLSELRRSAENTVIQKGAVV